MIRVIFADDEPKLRRAWEKLFAAESGMQLAAVLPSADQLIDTLADDPTDVVVIDLTMPGLDPLDAIRQAAESFPNTRTVVYTAQGDQKLLHAAFDAGAWGYHDKLAPPAELFDVIRRVNAGECVFPPDHSPPSRA